MNKDSHNQIAIAIMSAKDLGVFSKDFSEAGLSEHVRLVIYAREPERMEITIEAYHDAASLETDFLKASLDEGKLRKWNKVIAITK
jgi:hypothetical protein